MTSVLIKDIKSGPNLSRGRRFEQQCSGIVAIMEFPIVAVPADIVKIVVSMVEEITLMSRALLAVAMLSFVVGMVVLGVLLALALGLAVAASVREILLGEMIENRIVRVLMLRTLSRLIVAVVGVTDGSGTVSVIVVYVVAVVAQYYFPQL